MGKIYTVSELDGSTSPLKRKLAQHEGKDLQTLVEKNLDLLLGEEIDPLKPRRWLLIKHEMPVPSPETGADLWSLDILVADQDAIPTLIECKLAKNGQAHREIVGQLFEYAANGRHYWTAGHLLRAAESTHADLPFELAKLGSEWSEPKDYFEAVEGNLRDARMRLIFLLDEAPQRLKMQLGFFHGRMPNIELFVLELQQFEAEGKTYVSPYLIRPQDIEPRVRPDYEKKLRSKGGQIWDQGAFLSEIASHVVDPLAFLKLLSFFTSIGGAVAWGQGKTGAALFSFPGVPQRNFLNVQMNGRLWLNFFVFRLEEQGNARWNALEKIGRRFCGIELGENMEKKNPSISFDKWSPHIEEILDVLRTAASADGIGVTKGLQEPYCSDSTPVED